MKYNLSLVFAITKLSQLSSQDKPHARLNCSSKWPNPFYIKSFM